MPLDAETERDFNLRQKRYAPQTRTALAKVYPGQETEVETRLVKIIKDAMVKHPAELRELGEERILRPDWPQQFEMIGYVACVDWFVGSFRDIVEHIDYLKGLGVTYLHVIPFLRPREDANDGGYVVQGYRQVGPDLGTMDDLGALTATLGENRISLETDLVLNHVARKHEWAEEAGEGDPKYQDYFLLFPDRKMPDESEKTLPEISPDFVPGNPTWSDAANTWVWTTLNEHQWDLNQTSPEVLYEFVEFICWLVNKGVDVLRLDAIVFIWKRLGTNCQNQSEAHDATQVLRGYLRMVAPAVAFKAEVIVAPKDLMPYLGVRQYHGLVLDMAYHNEFMVWLWNSIVTGGAEMAQVALSEMPDKPTTATQAIYVRCHDDIGWAISDHDARMVGVTGSGHHAYLLDFYPGRHLGSFSRGLVLQENPVTGDHRILGSCASLAGLEKAVEENDAEAIDLTAKRIALMYAAVCGYGGVPLLYMGDEPGLFNDMSYVDDPAHAEDNRRTHRPLMDRDLVKRVETDVESPAGRVNAALRHILVVRAATTRLHASVPSIPVESPEHRLLILERDHPLGTMAQVCNFTGETVASHHDVLARRPGSDVREFLGGYSWDLQLPCIDFAPYQTVWSVLAETTDLQAGSLPAGEGC